MSRHDKRTGRTIALVGGGALLAWWLLRGGEGWRFGRGSHWGADSRFSGPRAQEGPPCRVHVGENAIRLDGHDADLTSVIAACQARGKADVTASGAAIVGAIKEVLLDLKEAGVRVYAEPDLWDLVARTG